jgi:hypothetical protein
MFEVNTRPLCVALSAFFPTLPPFALETVLLGSLPQEKPLPLAKRDCELLPAQLAVELAPSPG